MARQRRDRTWAWLFVTLLALLSCAPLLSCSQQGKTGKAPESDVAAVASADRPVHPVFLWQTQSSAATAYLLGSIHVAREDIYPLDERIERAFAASDHLVLEADLDDEVMADSMVKLVEQALLPPGENLFDQIDPELGERLSDELLEVGLSPESMSRFKPWFVTMTLSSKRMEDAGYTGESGIDQHFRQRAEGNKEILALETVDEQIQLLVSLGDGAQQEDLEMALEHDDAEFMEAVFDEWQRGETAGLEAEMAEMRREYPLAFEAMFTKRNLDMSDGIVELLAKPGTYFVVVGAGHLVGKQSIIDVLQQRGYTLTQL